MRYKVNSYLAYILALAGMFAITYVTVFIIAFIVEEVVRAL